MTRQTAAIGIWLLLVCASVWALWHANYTADLSAFLPLRPTPAQRLLVEELRDGPASRLMLIAIQGSDGGTRARVSAAMAAELRRTGLFDLVSNGDSALRERDAQFLFEHRYLLSDSVDGERFTVAGLRSAIADSIDLLGSSIGLITAETLPHDPTGEALEALHGVLPGGSPRSADGVWTSRDGERALLVAHTVAAGSDLDGQAAAMAAAERAYSAATGPRADPNLKLELSGPGVFAVRARDGIVHDAERLAVTGLVLTSMLLLAVYRSIRTLAVGLLPVATGAVVGVAAVAAGFGVVHGVTLGFGVTLIGEAMDYSVYFFIQTEQADATARAPWSSAVWPTVRLGMLTSVCGFASLLPSPLPGIAQLGLYSVAGLLAAALFTRHVLPVLLGKWTAPSFVLTVGETFAGLLRKGYPLRRYLWVLGVAALAVLYFKRDALWAHDLSVLSPVAPEAQALDASLRRDLGAPDVRTLIVVTAPERETAVRAAERLSHVLDRGVADGALGGYDSPSHYLPSESTQRARLASLPDGPVLQERLVQALKGLPLRADRLQPFLADVDRARASGMLDRAALAGTSYGPAVDALLHPDRGGWVALLPVQAQKPIPAAIDTALAAAATSADPGVTAVTLDLKRESDQLYDRYLSVGIRWSLVGLAAIAVLLAATLRSASAVARVLLPLVLAVLTTMAALALSGAALTIMHLIGLLLIVAVGSNYALFFVRGGVSTAGRISDRTLASLVIANAATVIGFGVLAFASAPVLKDLGLTVAPGAVLALLLSAILAAPAARPAQAA